MPQHSFRINMTRVSINKKKSPIQMYIHSWTIWWLSIRQWCLRYVGMKIPQYFSKPSTYLTYTSSHKWNHFHTHSHTSGAHNLNVLSYEAVAMTLLSGRTSIPMTLPSWPANVFSGVHMGWAHIWNRKMRITPMITSHVLVFQWSVHCDVIRNWLWCHQQNVNQAWDMGMITT